MQTVRGYYDGEKVTLLEKLEVKVPCKVIVIFLDAPDLLPWEMDDREPTIQGLPPQSDDQIKK